MEKIPKPVSMIARFWKDVSSDAPPESPSESFSRLEN